MNQYQTQLFTELQALIASNEAFYAQTFESNGHIYKIYNYRLASYTDFLAPSALESRGVMFEVDASDDPVELKVLPQPKFFNAYENPFTMDLDFTAVDAIYDKLDGSLMSTYMEDGQLKLKSKGSISSEQALAAMDWLDNPDQAMLYHNLASATEKGWTINLEFMSPNYRIVLGYMNTHCKVLNARNREDGSFVEYDLLQSTFGAHNVVSRVIVDDTKTFIDNIPGMQDDIEGYVVWLSDGRVVKIKLTKYLSLHHAKDSVNNPRRLFECILDEGVDDLRGMFYTDAVAMMMIDQMQVKVDHMFNSMVNEVETFYEMNKHLDRKDYAVKGQAEVSPMYFSRAMNLYLGKSPDYKQFMKSKWKELGFKDMKIEETGE
jgi:T4 RnlA family RNA ligase